MLVRDEDMETLSIGNFRSNYRFQKRKRDANKPTCIFLRRCDEGEEKKKKSSTPKHKRRASCVIISAFCLLYGDDHVVLCVCVCMCLYRIRRSNERARANSLAVLSGPIFVLLIP